MARRFAALRYMEDFRCIGAECEDNCCHLWSVTVDQSTHQRLKKLMGKSEVERFAKLRLLPPAERSREAFADIPDAAGGDCPMLDQRLCIIHGRYGPALLPAICATYPRQVSVVGVRTEMTGALSCPEVARRALLVPDAVQLRETSPSLFAGVRRQRTLDPTAVMPWESQLDEMRGTLYELLGLDSFPLGARLYFAMVLGEKLAGFFHSEVEALDLRELREAIGSVETATLREALYQKYRALPSQSPLALSLVAQALAARVHTEQVPRMRRLLDEVLGEYGREVGVSADGQSPLTLAPEKLAHSFAERWQRLREKHGERVESWLQNYAQHYVFHEWYCELPTLTLYVQTLALKLALLRFLVAGHPLAMDAPDQAVVQVAYTITRSIDHSPYFVDALSKVMREKLGPSATLALLKL
jgi:lysine-N-methylase